MYDTYGDSWNGATFDIDGQSATVPSGDYNEAELCLDPGCYDVTVGGGSWDSEISWELAGYAGDAPYSGQICVGDYEDSTDDEESEDED